MAGAYCWYASAKNVEEEEEKAGSGLSSKQCLPYYSYSSQVNIGWKSLDGSTTDWRTPTYEDMLHNGQYCVYGLAFPISEKEANCTQVDKVFFDESEIQAPY